MVETLVLSTHTAALFEAAVREAAERLKAGELVALPTETVYGLAANAWDSRAVARIYEIKGRPAHNPIIVHVVGLDLAARCVSSWPPVANKLARAFWPGPLSLVLPRSKLIPDIVTAGGPTVGIRWPAHPFIQAVIRACGFPLAAPSANPANQISPTNAGHVREYFEGRIPLIVDGGQSQVGIESSVVDLSGATPRLLRPGMIHIESILSVLGGEELLTPASDWSGGTETIARSPGLLARHYSPKARLVTLSWGGESDLDMQLKDLGVPPEKIHIVAHHQIPLSGHYGRVAVLPNDAEAFGRALYAELHQCDQSGAVLIVVEAPPAEAAWSAIADRLARAAG